MSTRYERGREAEYKVQRLYEAHGWVAFRTAGSHGPADIIAIGPKEIHLIQVKSESTARNTNYDAEIQKLQAVPAPAPTRKLFFVWKKGKGWSQIIEVTPLKSRLPTWLTLPVSKSGKAVTYTSST